MDGKHVKAGRSDQQIDERNMKHVPQREEALVRAELGDANDALQVLAGERDDMEATPALLRPAPAKIPGPVPKPELHDPDR